MMQTSDTLTSEASVTASASATQSAATQSVESVLQADWPLPLWLTIVAALALLAIVGALYWSERGNASRSLRLALATIRFILLALVVWMWAGWSWLQYRSDKPELLVMIDRSASMDTPDGKVELSGGSESSATKPAPPLSDSGAAVGSSSAKDSQSRLAVAKQIFSTLKPRDRERLERTYQLRWLLVDEVAERAGFSLETIDTDLEQVVASGGQSRLGDSLSSAISSQAGRGTAAIVFVSDGINTSGAPLAAAAAMARSAAIPVFAVATGQELALPDVRLADLLIDEAVFLGDQVTLMVTVSISDVSEGNLTVRLRDQSSGEVLDQQPLKLDKQHPQQQISLTFVPKRAGELPLQVDVSEVPGETNLENNTLQRSINVQDKTLRVLLVQRQPSFEFRFLKNLLQRSQATDARSASFELNSVLQESDNEYVEQDAAAIRLVPSDAATLATYDVFIFGDINPELISRSAQQAIFEQVTASGAGCIFIAGRDTPLASLNGWPLGDLLPVQIDAASKNSVNMGDGDLSAFAWSPTALGSAALPLQLAESSEASAKIWSTIPAAVSLYTAFNPKVGSQVLAIGSPQLAVQPAATGQSQQQLPLLISQFAGAGRVALQATDETYRWSSFGGSDRYHQRYWEQMLRWLSRGRLSGDGKQTQLTIEPRRAKWSQPIRFELQLAKDADAKGSEGQADVARPPGGRAEAARAELMLEDASGKKIALPLARDMGASRTYSATKWDLPPGSYRAVLFQPSLQPPPSESFNVITPPGEQANLRADWTAMRQLAEQSRGRFYLANQTQRLFSDLPAGKPARLGTLPPLPLWNSPWIAALFVILLTSEWLLRRKARML